MRPSNKSRSRNKPGNNGNHNNQRRNQMGNIINRVFESAGPDGKVRGTPQQIIDKYQALARDAQVAGDRVAAESYLQHSEHYSRLLGEAQRQQMEHRASQEQQREEQRGGEDGGFEPRRQPQPLASGLTTIDPEDSFDSGPIETPESRRRPRDESAPIVDLAPRQVNGAGQPQRNPEEQGGATASQPGGPAPQATENATGAPQAVEAAVEAPAERPKRTRRRSRAEAPAEAPEPAAPAE